MHFRIGFVERMTETVDVWVRANFSVVAYVWRKAKKSIFALSSTHLKQQSFFFSPARRDVHFFEKQEKRNTEILSVRLEAVQKRKRRNDRPEDKMSS